MKKLPSILFVLLVNITYSQNILKWESHAGSTGTDGGYGVTVDKDGNVITAGFFIGSCDFDPDLANATLTSYGSEDCFIAKYDSLGSLLWAINMGSSNSDKAYHVTTDSLGNIYTTGYIRGAADFDPDTGSYIITNGGGTHADIFVAKYSPAGDLIWAFAYGDLSYDAGVGIAYDPAGYIYVSGSFEGSCDFDPNNGVYELSAGGVSDLFLAKYNLSGQLMWAISVGGGSGSNTATNSAFYHNNSVIIGGYFSGNADFDPTAGNYTITSLSGEDGFVARYSSSGSLELAIGILGAGTQWVQGVCADSAGNLYVTGFYGGIPDMDPGVSNYPLAVYGDKDPFVAKYSSTGTLIWAYGYGSNGNDSGYGISIDEVMGTVVVSGYFSGTCDFDPSVAISSATSHGSTDFYLSSFRLDGTFQNVFTAGGAGADWCRTSVFAANHDLLSTGAFGGVCDFNPYSVAHNVTSVSNSSDYFVSRYEPRNTAGIADSKENQIAVFPNPCGDILKIVLQDDAFPVESVTLIDIMGKSFSVEYSVQRNEITLMLASLPAGYYVVLINGKDKIEKEIISKIK